MAPNWDDFTRARQITRSHWYFKDWGLFAYSFKQTADLSYKEYKETRRDGFWFPSMFLYRQWIELGLKSVWQESVRLGSKLGSVPKIHDLEILWNSLKPWLSETKIVEPDDEFVKSAERAFSILNKLDPDSTAFRYPPTALPHPDILNISLDDFELAIDEVDTIFVGLSAMFGEYEDFISANGRLG